MTVTLATGFEAGTASGSIELFVMNNGSSQITTTQHRTGARSYRCNPASAAQGYSGPLPVGVNAYVHFGLYIAAMPTADRWIAGNTNGGTIGLRLTSAGKITVYLANSTLIGTSTATLTTGVWYWIGFRNVSGTSVEWLQIDGANQGVTGTATVTTSQGYIGCFGTEATAIDVYYDDLIVDDTGFLAPSRVALLVPISDNARTAGWVTGAGGTTSLFDAVDNQPPTGVADTGTATSQIRNATAEASASYDANLTTYASAGIAAGDTVLSVQNVVVTAAPVVTSAKQGLVGMVSNPAITTIALASGGTAGAFWGGSAGGSWPSGWKNSYGTLTTSPSVTLSTSPVMRITQVTSSTQIADVCFMGAYVAWTPILGPGGVAALLFGGL